MSEKMRIMVLDDDPSDLHCTNLILSETGEFDVVTVNDPARALDLLRADPEGYQAILNDYKMKKDGLTTAQEMLAINPQFVIAILSADQSREILKKCISSGVTDFIEKTQDEEVIRAIVRGLCRKWQTRRRICPTLISLQEGKSLLSAMGIVGRSQVMTNLALMINSASKVNANVFVHGESGTGKELIARAIHNNSARKNRPFVAINVNAIPDNLAESELFGHVKGAFTGADRNADGKFLAAQGGTLFLDEIGDLKLDLQVKLLRVM